LDPQWAGGRPRQITTTERELIVTAAKTRPVTLGQPFTHWSIRKLADYLAEKKGPKVNVGRERIRQILSRRGSRSSGPRRGRNLPTRSKRRSCRASSGCWSIAVIARSRSTSSGRSPSSRSAGLRGRRAANRHGCGRTITSRTDRNSSTRGTRSARTSSTARSKRARAPGRRCERCRRSAPASMTASGSMSSWTTSTTTRTVTAPVVRRSSRRARICADVRVMGEPDRGALRAAAPVRDREQRPSRPPRTRPSAPQVPALAQPAHP
jgi:hypothetical protein